LAALAAPVEDFAGSGIGVSCIGDEFILVGSVVDVAESNLLLRNAVRVVLVADVGMGEPDGRSRVACCDTQISYGLTGQAIATSTVNGGSLALGEVQADLLFEDCKGIALELQGVIQKIIDWTVELNFGEAEKPPLFQFDIERKASFEQIMQAVDRKIPVSRSELYSSYGLPEPKDEDDAFVMEGSQMLLTDGARSSGLKKNFSFV